MPILNYSTKIEAEQTISEIQRMLAKHGVMAMMTEYDGRNVSAVSFKMNIDGKAMSFKMPCNWRAVVEIFKKQKIYLRYGGTVEEQAIKTSWRVIKDWIEAQLALVEINMVTIPQIFLPYMIVKGGKTLSEKIMDDPQFLLGSGE